MPSSTSQPDRNNERDREEVDRVLAVLTDQSGGELLVEPLSDLSRAAASRLRERWADLSVEQRADIVRAMSADAEANVQRNYDRVMLIAVDDEHPETRRLAVETLWERETSEILGLLLDRVRREIDASVRAAEAAALGRFALLAELEELEDADAVRRLRDVLLTLVMNDPSVEVRRRALESVAYLSGDDEIIEQIERAYRSREHLMRVSALHAMGRQANTRWLDILHRELGSDEPEMRYEAVVAAGAIGDERSIPALIDMLSDEDAEVGLTAIAALGAIGGKLAVNTLRRLAKDDSPAIADAAEDALEEAMLVSNPLRPLF